MADEFTFEGTENSVEIEDTSKDSQTGLGTLDVYADIVYCIDLTSSMKPIIDKVKATALTLHSNLQEVMQKKYNRSAAKKQWGGLFILLKRCTDKWHN